MHLVGKGRQGHGLVALSVVVIVGLLLAGCAAGNGTLSGRLPIIRGVDSNGHVSTVAAIHEGRVVAQVKVRPGGRFTLSVPAGSYQVGIWPPDQPPGVIECPGYATVNSDQTATVNLVCTYAASQVDGRPGLSVSTRRAHLVTF
jgi:hypothetical protein